LIDPKYAEAYYNRGVLYAQKGDFDRAIAEFTKALKFNAKDANSYMNRGIAYAKKGKYDRAVKDYEKALEINPRQVFAHFNKALAYEKLGRTKEAIKAVKAFIRNAQPQQAPYVNYSRQRLKELERKNL
jgi:tetratricopeptide (TPR) repeat protein